MTNYTPTDALSTVKTYDESDLVKGGIAGNSNLPIEALADQAFYLTNRLGGFIGIKDVTGSVSIAAADANKLISVVATANCTLTVDALSNFKPGARIAVVAKLSGAGGPFFVNVVTAENIINGTVTRTNIWLYDGEMIELIAGTGVWLWTIAKGNFDKIGEHDLKRFAPRNAFAADGTGGNSRAKYPRLWEVVSGSAVTDGNWLGGVNRYKAQYSTGNGTTDFRRPDYRGLFFRALDAGRGIDIARLDAAAGGYEDDAIKSFEAQITGASAAVAGGNGGTPNVDVFDTTIAGGFNGGPKTITKTLTVTGAGNEVRGKNIGFTAYIYY